MKLTKAIYATLALVLGFAGASFAAQEPAAKNGKKLDVLCIYYPHWHVYPLGECWKGKGWTEWENVKTAVPRYKGHNQPIRPLTGYLDGKSPIDVAKEIELASNSGIDVFVYDWYYYNKGVMSMQESLEEGFLKAPNRDKMKFALMWANHDRCDFFRPPVDRKKPNVWLNCRYDGEKFLEMIDYCIEHYFNQPNYYRPNGKIFFSIYLSVEFVKGIGGQEKTKALFAKADEKMKKAGLPPIYWNAITRNYTHGEFLQKAGFDCTMAYNIQFQRIKDYKKRALEKGEWLFDYSELMDAHREIWNDFTKKSPLVNLPCITRGWDSSARCLPSEKFPFRNFTYPYVPIVVNDTPGKFETLAREARDHAAADPKKPFAVLINGWNEYTEGAYLLPEKRYQMGYLQAIANVFGRNPADKMTVADPYSKKIVDFPAPTLEDVSYGDHYKQRMHVWLAKSKKPTPAVIYIHGGGWTDGARLDSRMEKLLPAMDKNGIGVISVEYRWIQDANLDGITPPVKAPLEDAARAVQFVRSKAKEWNIDASRLALIGGSAGACSSLWVSLSPDKADPNSADAVARESSRVKLASVMVAQTSLDPKQMLEWIPNSNYGKHAFNGGTLENWLKNRDKNLAEINKYSPYALASKGNPTIFHLTYPTPAEVGKPQKDPTHASAFGVEFQKKCDVLGIKCTTEYSVGIEANIDFILKNL